MALSLVEQLAGDADALERRHGEDWSGWNLRLVRSTLPGSVRTPSSVPAKELARLCWTRFADRKQPALYQKLVGSVVNSERPRRPLCAASCGPNEVTAGEYGGSRVRVPGTWYLPGTARLNP